MRRKGLFEAFRWDINGMAHKISQHLEFEKEPDSFVSLMNYFSNEKWNEFKQILDSQAHACNLSIKRIREEFVSSGHDVIEEGLNWFSINVNQRPFLIEKEVGKRYFTITNKMLCELYPMASEICMMAWVTVPRFVEYIEKYIEMLDYLPDVLRSAMTLSNKNIKIAAITLPYVKAKLEDSGVLSDIVAQTMLCGDYVALNFQISDSEKWRLILTEDNIDDVIRRLPIALNDVENIDFYFPSERFIIKTM